MLIKKKKTPTLKDIEKIFTYIPKIFIVLLGISLVFISYLILDSKRKKDVDLVEQKSILHYEFLQKENLNKFIYDVEQKIDDEFLSDELKLKQMVYQTIGYIKAKYYRTLNLNDLFFYLIRLQEIENVRFVVFDDDFNILYGYDTVSNIQKFIFHKPDDEKYQQTVLKELYSIGSSKLKTWRYNSDKSLILSFFDTIVLNKKTFYVGAISPVYSIKDITNKVVKNTIISLTNNQYNIWFYDFYTTKLFNFNNQQKVLFNFDTIDKNSKKYKILDNYLKNKTMDNQNEKYIYFHPKYNYLFGIDYDKHFISRTNLAQIDKINKQYKTLFYKIVVYIISLTILLLIFSFLFSKFIKRIFGKYNKQLKKKTDALEKHKHQMELLVIEEVEKNRKKDKMLIQQNKLAAMGGMLENIAHQWRQPLNNVNLILHFLRDNYQNKDFTKEMLEKYITKSKIQIDYMSHTIDDFRNFYKPSKKAKMFDIKDIVDDVLKISKEQLLYDKIEIKLNLCSVKIVTYENELKQTLLNILYNAKDAIVLRRKIKEFEGYIKIKVIKNQDVVKISIENNGGKIKKDIIEKIFEPYFTTKEKTMGTGIGLYMAKTIIETNMQGTLKVKNIKNGVKFTIVLPLQNILER